MSLEASMLVDVSVITSALLIPCHRRLIVISRPDLPNHAAASVVSERGAASLALCCAFVGVAVTGLTSRTSTRRWRAWLGFRFFRLCVFDSFFSAACQFSTILDALEPARRERCNEYRVLSHIVGEDRSCRDEDDRDRWRLSSLSFDMELRALKLWGFC